MDCRGVLIARKRGTEMDCRSVLIADGFVSGGGDCDYWRVWIFTLICGLYVSMDNGLIL